MVLALYFIVASLLERRGRQQRFLALATSTTRNGESDYDMHL